MSEPALLSLFLLGILGTGHCLGMCGPIVLAIPARAGRISAQVAYNMGRLTTYAGVGAIVGGAGAGMTQLAAGTGPELMTSVSRIQVGFSLLSSALLLVFGLLRLGILQEPPWLSAGSPSKLPGFKTVSKAATVRGRGSAVFLFGVMMGFLPCGLTYAALALALPSGGAGKGALLLLCFGLGTVPGLFLVGTAASGFFRRYRSQSDLLSGILMIGIGVSLAADALQVLAG